MSKNKSNKTDKIKIDEEFESNLIKYNPIIFDLNNLKKPTISNLGKKNDVIFSNNIAYPEFKLGFHHFIHQAKNKMEVVENFANRKKIYLVTSLFEKNIDYKEKTDNDINFTSIDDGIKKFIKQINPNFPQLLNRAFLKLWEILVIFDLIKDTQDFTSSHLAEGPGSFIQATILYRELQQKLGLIKSYSKDKYYGVTLHSDHEHLLMHKEFIKYFDKEKPKRLNILETKSINKIEDMYGGGSLFTNGDLTKIDTINIFGGSSENKSYSEPSDLVTADGGFDWKKENLQEQEAYILIFGEILTAIKIQKDGGSFVIKIFESFTRTTIKLIELLRIFYNKVYICKPYTSRISNSEKYIVCKDFDKSKVKSDIIKNLENMIIEINKNKDFNIIDIFTDYELDDDIINHYKEINSQLLLKQYIGINNIAKFINLDNYNGVEFNDFLDKQIEASHFWNNTFLNTDNYSVISKYFKSFDFIDFKNKYLINFESLNTQQTQINITDTQQQRNIFTKINKTSKINKSNKTSKSSKTSKTKIQKGGYIENELDDSSNSIEEIYNNVDNVLIESDDAQFGYLDSPNEDIIDLSKIKL